MSQASSHAARKELIQLLPLNENWVITVLGVNERGLAYQEMAKALNTVQTSPHQQPAWTEKIIKEACKNLEKLGLLESYRKQVSINPVYQPSAIIAIYLQHPQKVAELARYFFQYHRYKPLHLYSWQYRYSEKDYQEYAHRCHLLLLLNDANEYQQVFHKLKPSHTYYNDYAKLAAFESAQLIYTVFDADFWLAFHPYFHQHALFNILFEPISWEADTASQIVDFLARREITKGDKKTKSLIDNLGAISIQELGKHPGVIAKYPSHQALHKLLQGEAEAAADLYAKIPIANEFAQIVDIIQELCLYSQERITAVQMLKASSQFRKGFFRPALMAFQVLALFEVGNTEEAENNWELLFASDIFSPIDWMIILWCASWTGFKPDEDQMSFLLHSIEEQAFLQLPWVLGEITNSLTLVEPEHPAAKKWKTTSKAIAKEHTFTYLQSLLKIKEPWEHALHILDLVTHDTPSEEAVGQSFRTIWIVDFEQEEVFAKEQKKGARGWSKGRKLKWTELLAKVTRQELADYDIGTLNALSTFDGRAIMTRYYYSEDQIQADFGQVLYELVGHPRVYLDDRKRIPLDLRRGQPELFVSETDEGLQLRFHPPTGRSGYTWMKDTPTRYTIFELDNAQAKMSRSIGSGIKIPASHRATLETKLPQIRRKVSVQSTLDLEAEEINTYTASNKICVHLLPFGETYKLELYIKPLPEESIYYKPGRGQTKTLVILEEGRALLERNLAAEKKAVTDLLTDCPTLAALPHQQYEWHLADTQDALKVLLELRPLQQEDQILLEHPKGEKLKLVSVMGSDDLRLKIGRQKDWFSVSGNLQLDETRVLNLEQLLEHARNNEQIFVELADGEFMALTEELQQRLLQMEGLLHQRGKKLELPTLAAGQFAELAEGLSDMEADEAWTDSLNRIKKAQNIRPRVPDNLDAELRDYQLEGFRWLMRLATWGVGACLADDMGLGKTVQALAILCKRAEMGPALVIAPASVTRNWVLETQRFAPDLNPILLSSSNDLALLQQLDNGDILIVSYGLLSFVGEELTSLFFSSIVLDEAQAIKNSATKRSKLVRQLQGDFKLATTGTPIENNLGELWSLFRFLNPGLLGSKQAFSDKFEKPIVRYDDDQRREQLRNLVRPFILRRRKDEVLTELPAKTEIVLNVSLSADEKALYEALRRQALKEIEEADEKSRRFTVLAQLTRLRQAACHPRLVRPRSKMDSAKLELVGETIQELIQGGHKALIFSQFVKHLKIVENWVKHQGIPYQYLDGSTPGKKRQAAVDAFQSGKGELFLISLKAGGTGLNLTEADFVLHLDPWWNPAVEDQASDRAHRIGQQKPVTVYRFVSEQTIEEKIISLHADKRDLADQILSGTNQSAKLSVDEIMDLLR